MSLKIVLPLEDRLRRIKQLERSRSNYEARLLGHVIGLEDFSGKRVLEIGGTDSNSMANYFLGIGANYEQLRLEPNGEQKSYVRQMNFMDFNPDSPYDLIVSVGVFEEGAVDKALDIKLRDKFVQPGVTNIDRLRKLHQLTRDGGYNIIGTVSDPCMFSNEEIAQVGFQGKCRLSPFYLLGTNVPFEDTSELLVLQK